MTREVVVVSAVRTAIGTFGGSLKDVPPTELGALVVKESLARASVEGKDVGHVVFGHVVNTEPKDMYLSRVAAINGGCAEGTPAFNVNRLCGSGLQAIVSAAQAIQLGDADVTIGAGAEVMSRAPFASLNMRWGARMGDTKMVDMMIGALHDPFHTIHMGVTAENIAAKWGITREDQDRLAVESHNRAERATQAGYFKDQIVPVTLKSKKGDVQYATDEHFRPGATMDDMAKLKPAFLKENGTVTAGNASGINDAAAAVVLMEAGAAKARGAKIYAELAGFGMSADAGHMTAPNMDGPRRAMLNALRNAGVNQDQVNYLNAHGTSTPLGDINETNAIKAAFGDHSKNMVVSSTKSMTGHLLGAAGGIESVFTALALHDEMLPGTINLENPDPACDLDYMADGSKNIACEYAMCNSFGFGGTNGSLVFRRFAG